MMMHTNGAAGSNKTGNNAMVNREPADAWRRARQATVTVAKGRDTFGLTPLAGFGVLRSERPAIVFRSPNLPGVDVLVAPCDDGSGRPVRVYSSGASPDEVQVREAR